MLHWIVELAYLASAICFILGLKKLSSPKTARQGNTIAAVGMGIAIVATLASETIVSYTWIAVGIGVGSAIGFAMAKTVKMTGMPQMVAVLNGFGGGASQVVAAAELLRMVNAGQDISSFTGVTIQLASVIGAVTLAGSFVAFAKLQELISSKAVTLPGRHAIAALILIGIVFLAYRVVVDPSQSMLFMGVHFAAMLLGVLLVIAIGGADMPVVVSLLNSYSGVAGAMAGFVINNHALMITGALVGASGLILTQIMCKAMNRSIVNVIFGGFGATSSGGGGGGGDQEGTIRETSASDAAMLMAYSGQVVVVPGYGLAVAQAQHQVREMAEILDEKGVDVKYAIHPVAGRMPGHMNVLLAEADVPYDKLWEMERINSEFDRTDVVLVIGANDVVNPAARNNPESPIYGMPILDVDNAQNVIVMKRSMNPGFAGIQNELFFNPKTMMLFGDAKDSLSQLIQELKTME